MLRHHKFRFGPLRNFKVLLCRIFGHRLNENKDLHWCERCQLAYEEIYENYYDSPSPEQPPLPDHIEGARTLLNRAKNCIDHARKWRKNTDPGYTDSGSYRLVSEQIGKALKPLNHT